MTDAPKPDAPVTAPASMFSDCGDAPCPEPVLPSATAEQTAALTGYFQSHNNSARVDTRVGASAVG